MREILHQFSHPQQLRNPHKITADGNRFHIELAHSTSPLNNEEGGQWAYPTYVDFSSAGMGTRRILPPSEIRTHQTIVNMYPISKLELTDKRRKFGISNKPVDALKLVPANWTALLVVLIPEINETLESAGLLDIEGGKYVIGKALPVTPLPDTKRLCLPVYRLGQEKTGIDEAAEQIIYTIGLALASPDSIGEFHQVHGYARQFLQRTLGGKLLLLQAR